MVTTTSAAEKTIIVGGVDTHRDTHHAAVLDLTGRIIADQEFPVTGDGYQQLLDWIASHGIIDRVGIEITGGYGAGLTRHLHAAGVTVVEVNTSDKATRARRGKDDRIDAIEAARKVLSGMATATPKDTTGAIESIRMLSMARGFAVKSRTAAINQLKALIVTAPTPIHDAFTRLRVAKILKLLPEYVIERNELATPEHAVIATMNVFADLIRTFNTQINELDRDLKKLVTATAPTLIQQPQIGPVTAAQLLITAGANINRLPTDAAFARLCGAAPIPVSSGRTTRMRLSRGGDRQANSALYMIIVGRLRRDPETRAYMTRRTADGLTKKDIIRALKRFAARRIYRDLKTDLAIT